jgi:hypothetical protein
MACYPVRMVSAAQYRTFMTLLPKIRADWEVGLVCKVLYAGTTDGRMVLHDHLQPLRQTGALYHVTVTLSSCVCYGTPQKEVGLTPQSRA